MKRLYLHITGLVQGVGFRWHSERHARTLPVTGFVRNTDHHSVEIEIQGNEAVLDGFIKWLHSGISKAVVEEIAITEIPLVELEQGFHTKH